MDAVVLFVVTHFYKISQNAPECTIFCIFFQGSTRKADDLECAALRGESSCLPAACRDAPLGQRQGGVFRLPPPYLWTPPTPQRAKGYSPLTILKKKSKHKKASAAPVGAIALTLFSLLHP
ncbi:hypothetical protein FAEPRAM212_01075 [Faecalibacterium prausnitzii M21/2]|uniref:Uncharacterized protein n=1 Tax=Faecalibacterium prausnitzii M21/2 TaxID=411485 RepID=A8S9K3_9FIRM|nr:hypothetical protein FAEPRAM212_01075 [Faecalibacterium prausnitzii M21/2]